MGLTVQPRPRDSTPEGAAQFPHGADRRAVPIGTKQPPNHWVPFRILTKVAWQLCSRTPNCPGGRAVLPGAVTRLGLTGPTMRFRSKRLRLGSAWLASAASGPVPRISPSRMKRRICEPFLPACSSELCGRHGSARQKTPGLPEAASEAETPCFEGVVQCESSDGNYPTAPSRSGCNPRVPWAGSLSTGR